MELQIVGLFHDAWLIWLNIPNIVCKLFSHCATIFTHMFVVQFYFLLFLAFSVDYTFLEYMVTVTVTYSSLRKMCN